MKDRVRQIEREVSDLDFSSKLKPLGAASDLTTSMPVAGESGATKATHEDVNTSMERIRHELSHVQNAITREVKESFKRHAAECGPRISA